MSDDVEAQRARFFVPGPVRPQGSHKAFPYLGGACAKCAPGRPCGRRMCVNGRILQASITDDNPEVKEWKKAVGRVAKMHQRHLIAAPAPVRVTLVFAIHRPGGHFTGSGVKSKAGMLMPRPTKKPGGGGAGGDADKLERAILDALKGVMFEDDAQVADVAASKVWTAGEPGCYIQVEEAADVARWATELVARFGVRVEHADLVADSPHGTAPTVDFLPGFGP